MHLAEHWLRRPSPQPVPGGLRDVPSLLLRAAEDRPDQEALIGRLRRYTYRQLHTAVEAAAAALHTLGVRQGDRVACAAPNQADIIIAFLSVQRLGAVWVGVSRMLSAPETLFQLQDSGATIFMADRAAAVKLQSPEGSGSFIRCVIDMEPGDNEWLRLIESHQGQPGPLVTVDPFAPAAIAYTSGTTGRPKGAVHCQHTMVVTAVHAAYRSPAKGAALRKAATTPLTVLNLILGAGLVAFAGGGCFICMDRQDAVGVAEWIVTEHVESMSVAPPTILDFINRDDITPAALESMVALSCGGGPCPRTMRDAFIAKFGKPLFVAMGQTEAPTSVTGAFASECPPDSCGRAYDHIELVVKAPNGEILPVGERGEICIKSKDFGPWAGVYTPMLGYWNRPEATVEVLIGPWLHTGDIGYLDSDGWVFMVDRAKLVILRGGQNIYPAEIELVLKSHSWVKDAAVLAMPSDRFGESVLAAVQMTSSGVDEAALKSELAEMCARALAKYKWPEAWLMFTDFPRNAMMKVNRPVLQATCARRVAAGEALR